MILGVLLMTRMRSFREERTVTSLHSPHSGILNPPTLPLDPHGPGRTFSIDVRLYIERD
jgi:hypothetical protein